MCGQWRLTVLTGAALWRTTVLVARLAVVLVGQREACCVVWIGRARG